MNSFHHATDRLLPRLFRLGFGGALLFLCGLNVLAAETLSWPELMAGAMTTAADKNAAATLAAQSWKEFPVETEWFFQDNDFRKNNPCPGARDVGDFQAWLSHRDASFETGLLARVLAELGDKGAGLADELKLLVEAKTAAGDMAWLKLYHKACELRRAQRFAPYVDKFRDIVFVKRYNAGHTSFWQVTEDCSGGLGVLKGTVDLKNPDRPSLFCNQTGWNNRGNISYNCSRYLQNRGGALCLLRMDGIYGKVETLVEDKEGAIRDPDISWDGKRILFSWKKSPDQDDYHLYEMDLATKQIRQLTHELGVADYEGIYQPDGNILYASTRCIQLVDCWTNPVANLYRCDKDGKHIRRVCVDQVHDNYPKVLPTGQVIYTRWDYNDRSRLVAHPLFIMNPDGTRQIAYFGGSATLPALIHSRPVPGTDLIVTVLAGHHCPQAGPMGLLDRKLGDQSMESITMVAPVRKETEGLKRLWKAQEDGKVPPYGDANPLQREVDLTAIGGHNFAYPWPLDKNAFLVNFKPHGTPETQVMPLYFLMADGRRELLVNDGGKSCAQPVVAAARPVPSAIPSSVDYSKTEGRFFVQDIYAGESLKGVPRGTVKKIRVVALHYRADDCGVTEDYRHNPIAPRPNGPWMSKEVLGDTEVCEDGSVAFSVPSRTPVYFQALDAKGNCLQTMRSWVTVQPGETHGCVGCHENKVATPAAASGNVTALKRAVQSLLPFYGPARPFSYPQEIQPILDAKCVRCHDGTGFVAAERPKLANGREYTWPFKEARAGRPLLVDATCYNKMHRKAWNISYLQLLPYITPLNCNLHAEPLVPGTYGAITSPLIKMLEAGHRGVTLTREEMDKFRCWIDLAAPHYGDYAEGMKPEDLQLYQNSMKFRKKYQDEEAEDIRNQLSAGNP